MGRQPELPEHPRPSMIGRLPSRQVRVYIRPGLAVRLGRCLAPQDSGRPVGIVYDSAIPERVVNRLSRSLRRVGWTVHKTELPGGEIVKTQALVQRLHESWFERHYDRTTPIVVLGGGAMTDTVGFAAATFMRGLPLWLLPTTIIGQVDAAIGGKVGINHRHGKNLVGCYYHPEGIVVDPHLLVTLPERERRSGLAEVVKYGMIGDARLFQHCERRLSDWVSGRTMIPIEVIRRCVRQKLAFVASDETDHGRRHLLNFGHTLGHAIERWGNFRRFRHGEAVAMGMIGAAQLARQRTMISQTLVARLDYLCYLLKPARVSVPLPVDELIEYLALDKKRRSGKNVWILPRGLGRMAICDDISIKEVRQAIANVEEWLES